MPPEKNLKNIVAILDAKTFDTDVKVIKRKRKYLIKNVVQAKVTGD